MIPPVARGLGCDVLSDARLKQRQHAVAYLSWALGECYYVLMSLVVAIVGIASDTVARGN